MATSILRVGRLTSLKFRQLERCGILGTPSFCTLVEEPIKPAKKPKSKVIEAPDERASLLAYKTVVGFPVKLFASGILQTPALSEIESLTYPVAVETLVDTVGPAIAKAKSAAVEEQVTTEESIEHVASPVVDLVPTVATVEDPVTLSESVTVTTTTPVSEEANTSIFAQGTATEAPTPVFETAASQESSATPIMDSVPVFEASPYAEPVSLEVTAGEIVTFEITGAELPVTQKAMVFEAATVSVISTHMDGAPVVGEVLYEDILAVASSTVDPVVTATASSEPVDVSSSSSSDSDSDDEKSDDEKSEVKINGQSKEADLTENKVKDHVSDTGHVSVIPAEDLPVVTPLVTTETGYGVVEAQAAPEVTAVKEAPTVVPETLPKPFLEVAGNHALAGGSEVLIESVLEIATDPKELMADTAPDVEVTATEVIAAALHMVHAAAEDASESIPAEALGEFKSVAEAPTADPKELMAEAAPGVDVTTTESITAVMPTVHAAAEYASESIPPEALGELKSVAEAPTADPKELMAEAAPGVDVTTTESITTAVHMVHAAAEDASESIPAEALGEFKSVAEAPAEVILVKAFPEAASEDIPAHPAAETIPVEAADKVTAEVIAENISESPPVESTEEQLDLAPVVAQVAGEELQTETQEEPEPVEASEEAATTSPQAEPEPFDISTYKNYQHHSYNPYTFADLDLEMFKYRLPQPSSGRPSPRH